MTVYQAPESTFGGAYSNWHKEAWCNKTRQKGSYSPKHDTVSTGILKYPMEFFGTNS